MLYTIKKFMMSYGFASQDMKRNNLIHNFCIYRCRYSIYDLILFRNIVDSTRITTILCRAIFTKTLSILKVKPLNHNFYYLRHNLRNAVQLKIAMGFGKIIDHQRMSVGGYWIPNF